jgi:hypothetical protein
VVRAAAAGPSAGSARARVRRRSGSGRRLRPLPLLVRLALLPALLFPRQTSLLVTASWLLHACPLPWRLFSQFVSAMRGMLCRMRCRG